MKRNALLMSVMLLGLFLVSGQQKAAAQEVTVSYQTFYDELSPYGQWVEDPEYGNVWVPNEEAGYRPYGTDGHWVMTDQGNMWVSDAPYGWAAYHYGRWTYNSYYGWVWIPGYEWAPAWVSWRSGGGYYGWAPMGPGYVAGGVYDYPDNYWVFVGPQYLYEPNVYGYYHPRHVRRYIRSSSYITETYVDNGYHSTYYYGPRREVIERESNRPVQVYRVSNANAPRQTSAGGGVVQVYRPVVNQETRTTARPQSSVRATQPVGRPQSFSRFEGRMQPEFRQQIRSGNVSSGNSGGGYQPQSTPRQQSVQQGGNSQPSGRPQPQRFGQPSGGRQEPRFQSQPQNTQPSGGRQEPRFQSQPQINRPQAQPQMQQPRTQPQPQGQSPRPVMQQSTTKPGMRDKSDKK